MSDYRSFEGVVRFFDKVLYVNTSNGIGLGQVIIGIKPYLCKMARKYSLDGMQFEDKFNELVLIAIDGVRSFNPKSGAKLSSFLYIHLKNRMVSKVKSDNKEGNDASLNPKFNYDKSGKFRIARRSVNFSSIIRAGEDKLLWEPSSSETPYSLNQHGSQNIIDPINLKMLSKNMDTNTANLITLVCNGYSIPSAAVELNISVRVARSMLKHLASNAAVVEFLRT